MSGLAPAGSRAWEAGPPTRVPSPSILLRLFPQDHSPPALAAVLTRGIFLTGPFSCCHAQHPRASARPTRRGQYTAAGHPMTVCSLSQLCCGLPLSGLEHRTCGAFPTLTGALVLSGRRLGAPEPNPTLPAQAKGCPTRCPPTSDANLGWPSPQGTVASSGLYKLKGPTSPLETQRLLERLRGKHSGLQVHHEGCDPGMRSGGNAEAGSPSRAPPVPPPGRHP